MPNFKGRSGGGPFKMKKYGQGKNPIQMSHGKNPMQMSHGKNPMQMHHGKSPAKGLFGKIGGAIKGAITGKDGKFGLADAGRLALGPVGLAMGAARGMKMTEKASGKSAMKMDHGKSPMKGYKSAAQRKAVHASKADGGAGNPNKMKGDLNKDGKMSGYETARQTAIEKNMKKSPSKMYGKKTPAKMYGKKKKQGKTLDQVNY